MMTVVEAAEYLGIHPRTLRRWAKQGNFKLRRIGRKKYLEASEVKAFLAGELEPFKVKDTLPEEKTTDTTGLITIPKAASYLGVHFTTLYRWVRAGKLYPVSIGWQSYLVIDDVEALKASIDARVENH